MRKKTIVLLILLCFLFSSCATFRLEKQLRKLNPSFAEWYEYHEILMDTKVPKWIDERNGREKTHFLRLPQELQLAYINMFWKIRIEGLREEYYTRIATANRLFSGEGRPGWKTDRGRVLLLCGFPHNVIHYPIISQSTEGHDLEGYRYEVWIYSYRRYLVRYAFEYRSHNTWHREYTLNTGNQVDFEKQCRKFLAPTEDGWDLWGSILLQWVKTNEK